MSELALIGSYCGAADVSKREFRIWYRVRYRVPASGAVGTPPPGGGVLLYQAHQRSEVVAPWHPPIASKLAPFLSVP